MGGEGNEGRLKEQLRQVSAYLLSLAEGDETPAQTGPRPVASLAFEPQLGRDVDDSLRLRSIARTEYRRRRARADHFDGNLFAEPAWDILLDLYVAHVDDLRISVTSACLASSSPPSTALRWIAVLEAQGLVQRTGDKTDQRRTWVALSELGVRKMTSYLRGKMGIARPAQVKCA